MKCQEEDNDSLYDFIEREAMAESFLSTIVFLPPRSSNSERMNVTVDGNGPLAGSKLHLFSHVTIEKEEGWNHELKPRPFHRTGFFVFIFLINGKTEGSNFFELHLKRECSTCQRQFN